tara:strand:- start:1006 stop:1179 length:174 start_codon:yes stop_codon:yes gene_type:complete
MSETKQVKISGKRVVLKTSKKKESTSSSDLDKHVKFLYREITELREKLEKVLVRMGL